MEFFTIITFFIALFVAVAQILIAKKSKKRNRELKHQISDVHQLVFKLQAGKAPTNQADNQDNTFQNNFEKEEKSENVFGNLEPFPTIISDKNLQEIETQSTQNEFIDLTQEKTFAKEKETNIPLQKTKVSIDKSQNIPPIIQKEKPKKKPKQPTDIEKFIGENLLVKIAVFILILGVGFLIKWGIDNDYINETMRIVIGFAAGGILLSLGFSHEKNSTLLVRYFLVEELQYFTSQQHWVFNYIIYIHKPLHLQFC